MGERNKSLPLRGPAHEPDGAPVGDGRVVGHAAGDVEGEDGHEVDDEPPAEVHPGQRGSGGLSHFEERAVASDEKCAARAFEERAKRKGA